MLESLRKLGCNGWRLGSLPFHPVFYMAAIAAGVYFVYPHYIIKASPMWFSGIACVLHNTNKYSKYVAFGLLFGSFGDIFLEMDSAYGVDMFIPGLIAFLIGHCFYIRAFFSFPPKRWAVYIGGPLCIAYYATVMSFLLSKVSALLIAPVAIYGAVITTMVFFGGNRFLLKEYWSIGTRICGLLGSLAFVTSDTILSFNTFYMDIKNSGVLIMVTYYLGQLLIAASCQFELTVEEDKDIDLDYDNATTIKNLLQP